MVIYARWYMHMIFDVSSLDLTSSEPVDTFLCPKVLFKSFYVSNGYGSGSAPGLFSGGFIPSLRMYWLLLEPHGYFINPTFPHAECPNLGRLDINKKYVVQTRHFHIHYGYSFVTTHFLAILLTIYSSSVLYVGPFLSIQWAVFEPLVDHPSTSHY